MRKPTLSESMLIETGLGFLGVGLALITPEKFPAFLVAYDSQIRSAGFMATLTAGILLTGALIKWLSNIFRNERFQVSVSDLVERLLDFDDSYALPSDFRQICSLGETAIGYNHASEDILRNRLQKCPHIVKKLTLPVNGTHSLIHGYYIVYPLTARGVNRIDTQQIVTGKSLDNYDIASNFRNAKSVYISMIFGDGLMSKAATLYHLRNDLRNLRQINPSIRKFYAKPSTQNGLRLLTKYGFAPIDSETGIWVHEP